MTTVSRWLSLICLPASFLFAQEPAEVRVVFAPELKQAQAPAAPSVITVAGGLTGIRLPQDLRVGMIATVGKDGKLQLDCGPLQSLPQLPRREAARAK
jgi:hypothetical protein